MTIYKFMPLMSLIYNQCQKPVRVRLVYFFIPFGYEGSLTHKLLVHFVTGK